MERAADNYTLVSRYNGHPSAGLAIKLAPGAVLALYTDGLVESRTRSFTKGVLALRSAISGEHGDLTGTCDTLIESLRHREDDVTVLLARIPPGCPG